jgi:serine/threonine-protein kinase
MMDHMTLPSRPQPPSPGAADDVTPAAATSPDAVVGHPPGAPDLTGKTLGDFLVLRRLGQGGMGQVYLAEQLSLKRKVALKILKAGFTADATSLRRFQAEAEAVARVTHPNIVQVYAVGEHEGLRYMALEYVEGCNLREYLSRKGPPDLALAVRIMRQVTAALERAGELSIIHRDIKPENILLTRRGEVKVADFGLSRCTDTDQPAPNLTQTGCTMGTPLYMSPEQVQGHPLDPRTDIYSFGVTCYHMLAGTPPFQGQTAFDIAFQHVQGTARPLHEVRPDLPAGLCAIVDRMMAKRPADRQASAQELHQELSRFRATLGHSDTQMLPPAGTGATATGQGAGTKPGRSRRVRWLAASAVGVMLAGGGVAGWVSHREPSAVVPAPPETFARQQETLFLQAVQVSEGAKVQVEVQFGLTNRINLAVLYLDQWRLDDADRFFKDMAHSSVLQYEMLGRLGEAVVLAFEDKAAQSNERLLELFGENHFKDNRPLKINLVNRDLRFRQKIAEAVRRNRQNEPQATLPPMVRALERPGPFPFAFVGGKPAVVKRPEKKS